MNVDCLVHRLWQGEYREAPAVIKSRGKYYMITSFCTGWAPNQAKYAVADQMAGRWSRLMEIGDGENYFKSGYVVYPLKETDGRLTMEYCDNVDFGTDSSEV